MKYFTEYIPNANDLTLSKKECIDFECEWYSEQYRKYAEEFNLAKKFCTKSFLLEYQKDFLHDYEIKEIKLVHRDTKTRGSVCDFVITLYGEKLFDIIHQDVANVAMNISQPINLLRLIRYSEILPYGEEKYVSHEIRNTWDGAFDEKGNDIELPEDHGVSIKVVCRKIRIKYCSNDRK